MLLASGLLRDRNLATTALWDIVARMRRISLFLVIRTRRSHRVEILAARATAILPAAIPGRSV